MVRCERMESGKERERKQERESRARHIATPQSRDDRERRARGVCSQKRQRARPEQACGRQAERSKEAVERGRHAPSSDMISFQSSWSSGSAGWPNVGDASCRCGLDLPLPEELCAEERSASTSRPSVERPLRCGER